MRTTLRQTVLLAVLAGLAGASAAQESSPIWEGVYSAEQASRGAAVYSAACIACHGQDLGGNSNAPGLRGMGFMFLWEGRSLGEFFAKLRAEMPTDRPAQLPEQDYRDVVAYILQQNEFPAAAAELPLTLEALDAITIEAKP